MLISAVTPFMSIYHLPQGQYGYKGHVINMPQDLFVFATSKPRLPSELDVMIVRKKVSNNMHRDFRVRRMVVQRALQWLKRNNKYYRTIDTICSLFPCSPTHRLTLCSTILISACGRLEQEYASQGQAPGGFQVAADEHSGTQCQQLIQ